MADFFDEYLPESLRGFPFTSSPRWSTTITAVASGSEHRNKNWKHPMHKFSAPEAIRCHEQIEDLRDHWMVTGGPFLSFPLRDPLDFASRRLLLPDVEPVLFATDATLGVGDNSTTEFQLVKTYTRGSLSYSRKITLPIVDSVIVALNAMDPTTADPTLPGGPYTWDVERETGVITFDHAVRTGVIVTAGFLFDVRVRFESDDSLDVVMQSYRVDGCADLTFLEVRPCGPGGSE